MFCMFKDYKTSFSFKGFFVNIGLELFYIFYIHVKNA